MDILHHLPSSAAAVLRHRRPPPMPSSATAVLVLFLAEPGFRPGRDSFKASGLGRV